MVPQSLRVWFVIHFAADMLFALPRFCAPVFGGFCVLWASYRVRLGRAAA